MSELTTVNNPVEQSWDEMISDIMAEQNANIAKREAKESEVTK